MQPRMQNPGALIPEVFQGIQMLQAAVAKGDVPPKTLALAHLRASQINGCASCIDGGTKHAKKAGETDERLFAVSAWRDAPYFTPAERAALALSEAVTRIADRPDPVPDDVWNDATKHFDERALSALLLHIALTNVYNRFNVTTRQVAGQQKW